MFSFLERFLGAKLDTQAAITQPAPSAYSQLYPHDKQVVRDYYSASVAVCRMLENVRQRQLVDHDGVIARFDAAERHYSGIGFLPLMPGCMRVNGILGLSFFDEAKLESLGFLVRRESGKLPFFYAKGLRDYVERMLKSKPSSFVSSPNVAVLKTPFARRPAHQSEQPEPIGYEAWSPDQ